jgi:hypothetical protein
MDLDVSIGGPDVSANGQGNWLRSFTFEPADLGIQVHSHQAGATIFHLKL